VTVTDPNRTGRRADYQRDGFVAPVTIVAESEARRHQAAMEAAEAEVGPLHYREKIHTILTSPYELATHPAMLDAVESFIGPDILLYNVTYIVKEPHSRDHVP